MGYGHAHNMHPHVATQMVLLPDPPDPSLWSEPDVAALLHERDIPALYGVLVERTTLSQRGLAVLVGQSQSEVSEILKGRRVIAIMVLERIADGLGIPRGKMGLAYASDCPRGSHDPDPPEDDDMKRRKLIMAAQSAIGLALAGVVAGDEPKPFDGLVAPPVHGRVTPTTATTVATMREELRKEARRHGGFGNIIAAAFTTQLHLLDYAGDERDRESVGREMVSFAELAGWTLFDSGYPNRALDFFKQGVTIGNEYGDTLGVASILRHAGLMFWRQKPDLALKYFACGQAGLVMPGRSTLNLSDPEVCDLKGYLHAQCAMAYARMGDGFHAGLELAHADSFAADDPYDVADMALTRAVVHHTLGDKDRAETHARRAMDGFRAEHGRERLTTLIRLAELYVADGDARGLPMAESAIKRAQDFPPGHARTTRLGELAGTLRQRGSVDAIQLAVRADEVSGLAA